MFSLNLLKSIDTKFGKISWFNKGTLYYSSNALNVLKNCYVNGISNLWLEESKCVQFLSGWYFYKTNGVGMHSSAAQFKLLSASHALGSMKSQLAPSSVKSQLMTRFFKTQSALHSKSRPKCSRKPKTEPNKKTDPSASGAEFASIEDHFSLAMIIKSYQMRGHILAQLDPLKLSPGHIKDFKSYENPVLRDLPLPKNMNAMYMIPNFSKIGGTQTELTLTEVIKRLENAYCGSIGVEYFHNPMFTEVEYIKEVFEYPGKLPVLTQEEKIRVLKKIYETYQFEMFLAKKWPSEKRFGIDGSEVFIPAINHLIEKASEFGAKRFVIGMAHRGRLNLLANIMKMEIPHILAQFQPLKPDSDGTGDVKYHLGTQTTFVHPVTGEQIKISLVSNASHLESQATIVEGKTAAEQIFEANGDSSKVWPILVHGDAAMCGQGIVYETFHLSELNCYTTGGTIHFVINNQIGFTTDPRFSRSSVYCTSVSRITSAPVFHVNGDDVEAVIKATKVAADYRNTYKKDVVIDIVAYRRLGHNEIDEPMFTQPLMYKKVKSMKPVHQKYGEQLIEEKVVTKDDITKMMKEYEDSLEAGYQEAIKQKILKTGVWVDSPWKGFFGSDKDPLIVPSTGVKKTVLTTIGNAISTPPKDFNLHRALVRVFAQRKKSLESGKVDWACGESFAFASLLAEGVFVRLSGQDVERGTFSHRHHVLHDQDVPDKRINVLEKIFPNQATYSLCNSSLSENGVLGFELGMSLVNPKSLIIWEAQFGDFCNSAQIIIDQYLSSGESKWIRQVGLVMLLPHGMEGMGPEHSSARIERFLQMCNDDDGEVNRNMPAQLKQANWFVVNCSTPANFFHCLRRQVKLNYRKPLIVFSPKFLLRHPECVSSIEEFTGDTKFLPYLNDPIVEPSSSVKKLLLCSGKVYYELKEERAKKKLDDQIAIGRLEQISPVPYDGIMADAITHFPNARVFWVQEEHRNQGPWAYVLPRLTKAIGNEKGPINYIGRDVSSTAGTGYKSVHELERQQFLDVAMSV